MVADALDPLGSLLVTLSQLAQVERGTPADELLQLKLKVILTDVENKGMPLNMMEPHIVYHVMDNLNERQCETKMAMEKGEVKKEIIPEYICMSMPEMVYNYDALKKKFLALAFHQACEQRDFNMAIIILMKYKGYVDCTKQLSAACKNKDYELTKLILIRGDKQYDPNYKDDDTGDTLLHMLVRLTDWDEVFTFVKLLLQMGAKENIENKSGEVVDLKRFFTGKSASNTRHVKFGGPPS